MDKALLDTDILSEVMRGKDIWVVEHQSFQGVRDVGPSDLYRTLWDLSLVRIRIHLAIE
jgi:hypothetical protein